MSTILTVSQINTYLKSIMDGDFNLRKIYISGEISNFNSHYKSGHCYFSLKDENSVLKAVMFASSASKLRFEVKNGMKVVVRGNISLYERDGTYQLYADEIIPDGIGELAIAFEQLKEKLNAMGMFDESHKKMIPKMPTRVGVVTSASGAALHDITSIIQRRFPMTQIILEPVQVQGENAGYQIAKAIDKFNEKAAADVLIIGRGGGSMEDLWAFNEEIVAHSIFSSEIPIISAVGHETDFTIADFVSDLRAATPSAAAELVVPDTNEVLYAVDRMLDNLNNAICNTIGDYELQILTFEKFIESKNPNNIVNIYTSCLNEYDLRINNSIKSRLEKSENELANQIVRLEYANPLKALARGFAMVYDEQNTVVKSIENMSENDNVKLRLNDGYLNCTVNSKETINS